MGRILKLVFVITLWLGIGMYALASIPPADKDKQLSETQILHRGNGAEPETLDPHKASGVPAVNILLDLYEGLVSITPDGELTPGVAQRWTISADSLTYTFFLRKNAKWSNGQALTADDFVAGIRRTVTPAVGSAYADSLFMLKNARDVVSGKQAPDVLGVVAVDDHTLQITLQSPTPYFLALLTHPSTFPIYQPALKKWGDKFTQPGKLVSNGAFQLDEWVVQGHITLTRNPNYWNNARTTLDKVIYYGIEDKTTELYDYRAGQLDYTYEMPTALYHWIKTHFSDELHIAAQGAVYYYDFNLTKPPFKGNRHLRRALSLAVDRDVIANKIKGAGEQVAYGVVPPGTTNYQSQSMVEAQLSQSERNKLALDAYQEAGYSKDKPLTTTLYYNTDEDHKRVALAITQMWRKVLGVQTDLINQEWKVFLQDRRDKDLAGIYRDGWVGDYNDANAFLEIFTSNHGQNNSGYHNLAYDKLIAQASRQSDLSKRRQLLQKAERLLMDDFPIIPIHFYVKPHLIKPYVGGFSNNVLDQHLSKDMYIRAH